MFAEGAAPLVSARLFKQGSGQSEKCFPSLNVLLHVSLSPGGEGEAGGGRTERCTLWLFDLRRFVTSFCGDGGHFYLLLEARGNVREQSSPRQG